MGLLALFSASLSFGQAHAAPAGDTTLAPRTIVPITFTTDVSADRAKPGDAVVAKTTQVIRLANGQEIRRGAEVLGHVVNAQRFVFNKTPYARQSESFLAIQFDTLVAPNGNLPLHVYLRAIADRFATDDAFEPGPSDEDPLHSTTQVGGDIVTPSQNEIVSPDGDTVGYNRREGNFANLISNVGAGGMRCDAGDTEQPISIFSASACGMYGFHGLSLQATGYPAGGPQFSFFSTRRTPVIPRYSSALLEALPEPGVTSTTP